MKVIMYIVSNAMNFYESHEDHMHSYQMTTFTTLPGKTLIRIHPPPLSSLLYSLLSTQLKLFILHRFTRLNCSILGYTEDQRNYTQSPQSLPHKTVTMKATESKLTLISSVFCCLHAILFSCDISVFHQTTTKRTELH